MYEVRSKILNVFSSYFDDRWQFLKIGETFSNPLTIKIVPILVITYINSVRNAVLDNGYIVRYVDDTIVFLLVLQNHEINIRELME